jgi:hypothetical protein
MKSDVYGILYLYHLMLPNRPDWPSLALNARDFSSERVAYDSNLVQLYMTEENLRQFFNLGWTIFPNANSHELLNKTRKITNYWLYKHSQHANTSAIQKPYSQTNAIHKPNAINQVDCVGDLLYDPDVLTLYYDSPLPHIVEAILGTGEVSHPTAASKASFVYPSFDSPHAIGGDKWMIDGFTETGDHSPYNILVGIALSDCQDQDMVCHCLNLHV